MDGTNAGAAAAAELIEPGETSLVLRLKRPLAGLPGQGEITELHLEEPNCGQWLHAAIFTGPDAELQLLASVTKVSPSVLKKMAISDFVKATSFLSDFAKPSPVTGQD